MTHLIEVKVPHSGSVEHVEIAQWLVQPGDVVAESDFLAEVSTDKVDTELEAPQGGRVARLLYAEGDEVAVGTVVVLLVDADADPTQAQAAADAYVAASA